MSRFSFTGMYVQGDPHKPGPQRKDNAGALKFRKDGQPDCPFYIGIAIPKDPTKRFVIEGVPDYDSQRAIIDGDARAAWPHFFGGQRPAGLNFDASLPADCTNPKFANKIVDGDGFDENGQPNSTKDGWAGCWILKFSNGFAPSMYEWATDFVDPRGARKTGWVDLSLTGRTIKPGNIVTVSGDCTSNQSTQSPGMYLNFDTVSFEDDGRPIVITSMVNPEQALGTRGNAQPAAAASRPAPAATTEASTTAAPYDGYRQPAAGAGAPPPPPADGPEMTDKATCSYDEYVSAGWSDAQLRKNGLMV